MVDAILGFWWQHAPVLSVLLPSFTAVASLLIGDFGGMTAVGGGHDRARVRWRRRLSLVSVVLGLVMAAAMVWRAHAGLGSLAIACTPDIHIHIYNSGDGTATAAEPTGASDQGDAIVQNRCSARRQRKGKRITVGFRLDIRIGHVPQRYRSFFTSDLQIQLCWVCSVRFGVQIQF